MRRSITFLCALLLCVPLLFATPCVFAHAAATAAGECVVETTSKRFLHQKNADAPLPMASTTKILTALLIVEDCDLGEVVTVPEEAEGTEGSSVYLHAGDEYTVEELLYGLMLRSGNDCAVTLALHHSGSIPAFARAMNAKAVSIGAEHGYFANPHGLPDDRHCTTARDLALIAAYAMENETFRNIVSCKFYAPRGWKNKNKMLWSYEGADGVKTGYTVRAGKCLVTSAVRNGMRLVCVLLDCPATYDRTAELLDEAFGTYALVPLCSESYEGFLIKGSFSYPLTERERENISYETDLAEPLPASHGEFAGQMRILLENNLIFSQNLYII